MIPLTQTAKSCRQLRRRQLPAIPARTGLRAPLLSGVTSPRSSLSTAARSRLTSASAQTGSLCQTASPPPRLSPKTTPRLLPPRQRTARESVGTAMCVRLTTGVTSARSTSTGPKSWSTSAFARMATSPSTASPPPRRSPQTAPRLPPRRRRLAKSVRTAMFVRSTTGVTSARSTLTGRKRRFTSACAQTAT